MSRPAESARGWRRGVFVGLLFALVIAIAIGARWYRDATKPSVTSAQRVNRPLTRLTFDAGLQTDAAFSPDGRSIAYASDRAGNFDIWVQSLYGGEARQLTHSPASDTQPAWSPDGRHIVFRSERNKGGLFLVPAEGGPERQLTSAGMQPVWSADGSEILFRSGFGDYHSGIHAVSPEGHEPSRELVREFLLGGVWNWIAPHPDGRISAMGLHVTSRFGFYTVSRDGKRVVSSKLSKQLPLRWNEQGTRPVRFQWNDKGTALYLEAISNEVHAVWRIRVDPSSLEWIAAERLTTGSGPDVAVALSRNGERMAFTRQRQSIRLWIFPIDSAAGRITGKGAALSADGEFVEGSALSPDGRFVAFTRRRSGSTGVDMLLADIDANTTGVFGVDAYPGAWSPDSRTLAYALGRPDRPPPGEWALAVREVEGPERIIRRWSTESAVLPTGWTPDGRFILGSYVAPLNTGVARLALWPLSASALPTERVLLADAQRSLWQGSVSPNGRWLCFVMQMADDPSDVQINVAPAGAPSSEWIRIAPHHPLADKPRWAPDGRVLYFISTAGSSFMNLWGTRFDPDRGPFGAPFAVTKFDSPDLLISPNVTAHEIGISARRALLTMTSLRGNIWILDHVDR